MNKKQLASTFYRQNSTFCDENPADCHFELMTFPAGTTICNDTNINYLIFCHAGHARIASTLFHDEILCRGEVMFIPRQSEYTGTALSDVTLLIHKFNNTVCKVEKCILSHLYSHRNTEAKIYCCKLDTHHTVHHLIESITTYINDNIHDNDLWKLKHKELIWVFTHYYEVEEVRSFFHPMVGEQVSFKNLVLTHYRKANNAEELAEMCGYAAYTFSRKFKREFGISVYQWMILKRAELIKFRLTQSDIPLADIMIEFNFSSPQHLNTFCKKYLGQWTGSIADLVELIYALDETKSINNGDVPITELAMFFGTILGVDLRECYGSYVYIKKRKNNSRTYFLDKMSKELNKRMERDDDREQRRK